MTIQESQGHDTMHQISITCAQAGNSDDSAYHAYLGRVQDRFSEQTRNEPLFTTDADDDGGLWEAYLSAFPTDERQFHNCSACRHFIQRYGALVVIDEAGNHTSAVFSEMDTPPLYLPSVTAILKRVRRARVNGVFLTSTADLGQSVTGVWRHLALKTHKTFKHPLLTAGQAAAAKREDHHTVARALADFSAEHIATAVRLLKSDALYRSEKVLGAAEWLEKLHADRAAALPGRARDNVLWRAVAQAPAGFCHPRSGMIGTLLEDIAAGMSFDAVSARFAAKMHPLQYQRPTAAPSAGNIAQAEKLIESMGVAESLKRRFARLSDLEVLWYPTKHPLTPPGSGIFSHLVTRESGPARRPLEVPQVTMTWEKFARTVLLDADEIELRAPGLGNYAALVTAENPDAPPILQWDSLDQRNPVSWYVYNSGTTARQWGLQESAYVKVTGVSLQPTMWHDPERYKHHGKSLFLILEGAKDSRNSGLALFPETLKTELHAIRATIEAFSHSRKLTGEQEASACGLRLQHGSTWDVRLRVTSGGHKSLYKLDRWD